METTYTPNIELNFTQDGQMYISAWKVTGKREVTDELEDLGFYTKHEKAQEQARFWKEVMKWSETKIEKELIWL